MVFSIKTVIRYFRVDIYKYDNTFEFWLTLMTQTNLFAHAKRVETPNFLY